MSALLGATVDDVVPLSGGSIHGAWAVGLGDGRRVFVKASPELPPGMFAAERRGLAWLGEGLARAGAGAEGLRVPAVLACADECLVLELLEPGPPVADFDERLGRGLAALHRSLAPEHGFGFGFDQPNWIGSLPQANQASPDWPSFYRERRLEPLLVRAGSLVPTPLRRRFDRVFDRLDALCGPPEPPARLHGDLWSGNLHRDAAGLPVLIDPAVYAGHREVDLAMMRLFGGFSPRVFAAYNKAAPLAEGWERRVDLYQLYPLLVHVGLFGGGYVPALSSAVDRLLR